MSIYATPQGKRIELATLSRRGEREQNEDACGYWTSEQGACFVVSDGAGGHGGGEMASETAVRTVLSAFSSAPSLTPASIEGVIAQADSAIRYGQRLATPLRSMSATVAALFFDERATWAQWAHLGDTRLYLFRRRGCQQLTKDHSVVQNLIDAGMLAHEDAKSHADRNLLYAALGAGDTLLAKALKTSFEVREGDAFLICTDGFWGVLSESRMNESLMHANAAEEWLVRMEKLIVDQGVTGQDNYSALAVWIGNPNDVTVFWEGRDATILQ